MAHTDDSTDVLAPAGFAMGVLGSPDFDQLLEVEYVLLQKGDRILLFTDGLTEAMNSRGEEFGMARILRVLSHGDRAATAVTSTLGAAADPHFSESVHDPADLKSMEIAVEHHVAGAPQSDDLTMVFLEAT